MAAVSNAGPLIHLSRAGLLDLLEGLFAEIYVPGAVWEEVVERGEMSGKPDALLVKGSKWIRRVGDPGEIESIAERAGLHRGEASAILLAKSMGVPVLLDDSGARRFAQGLGLAVIGSVGVIIRAVKEGLLELEDGLKGLERLAEVMWLSVDVYEEARKAIEGMRGL